ncbi:uncharacterized protein [Montipora foliosa]|uniref:uncharacterized protein n=1 Tax=Montipora foliosa TaxID=591990 RepID=UPI0035F201FD
MDGRENNRMNSSSRGQTRRTTYDDLRGKSTESGEFIAVPKHLLGYVIGKNGNTIKELQKHSGAMITQTSPTKKPAGFMIRGDEPERACAKQLIAEKVAEVSTEETRNHRSPGRVVQIPKQFKKAVNGPGGDNLRYVSTLTGAGVTENAARGLYVTGGRKKVKHAEYLLRTKVASTRVRSELIRNYIDEENLPEECELKLVPLEGKDRMILAGARSQYRLRPADGFDLQFKIKQEINAKNYHKADMWCHFGTVVIRDPDEADVDETWCIEEATNKLRASPVKRSEWNVAFKEGIDLDHKAIQETFGESTEEDFMARYDLSFLSPRSQAIRCKVWVVRKDVKTKLEEIPVPFNDVSNIVEELRFEDEATRERCRGWLVLQSKKFFLANVIFPGCEIDYRFIIRALTDDVIAKNNGVHEQEGTQLLSRYLSKLKFTDADGLILPDDDLPHGYLFNYRRCAHRTLYTPRPGFTMIVSKESTWCRDYKEEESRKTTDIHLGTEEWDRDLLSEDWEPEMIVAKMPEFLEFVRDVHQFISNCCKNEQSS